MNDLLGNWYYKKETEYVEMIDAAINTHIRDSPMFAHRYMGINEWQQDICLM